MQDTSWRKKKNSWSEYLAPKFHISQDLSKQLWDGVGGAATRVVSDPAQVSLGAAHSRQAAHPPCAPELSSGALLSQVTSQLQGGGLSGFWTALGAEKTGNRSSDKVQNLFSKAHFFSFQGWNCSTDTSNAFWENNFEAFLNR